MGIRDPPDPCRGGPRPDDRGPGDADLPDHQLHVPGHRPRRRPVRAGRTRQHLHADHEPDPGRVRGAHRRPRGRGGRTGRVERPGRRVDRPAEPGRERRPRRVVGLALRRDLQPLPLHAAQARRRGHLRGRPRRPRRLAVGRPARTPRPSTPRPSATRRATCSTSPGCRPSPTSTRSRWWSTTPWPPRTCATRWPTAPTSSSTRPPSSSAATAPRSAA